MAHRIEGPAAELNKACLSRDFMHLCTGTPPFSRVFTKQRDFQYSYTILSIYSLFAISRSFS